MASQGNGSYMFDELTDYKSQSLNYRASNSSWHFGIGDCGMKVHYPRHQTSVLPTEGSNSSSSFSLDELLPFSHNTHRGNPLQNVNFISEQAPQAKFQSAHNEHGSKCNEESSGSEQSTEDLQSKSCARKRQKLPIIDPANNTCPEEDAEKESDSKRLKIAEGTTEEPDLKSETELPKTSSNKSQQTVKPSEPPKDYIHVRARRGQATDSHSLAERVRREKISERMKLLQDLVPGCNKITGKAVMLDEIINYVQSLQHQVEFLSMKLEAVNPRLDFNVEGFLPKDMVEPSTMSFVSDTTIPYPQFPQPEWAHMQVEMPCNIEEPSMGNSREVAFKRVNSGHLTPHECCGDEISQISHGWDNELQSIVQLGLGQNIQPSFSPHSFQGSFSTSYTNIKH